LPNVFLLEVKQYEHNYRDLPEKFNSSRSAFQSTQGHWNQHGSIGYLRLPISDP